MADRAIHFTQYLRPDGRKASVSIKRPAEIADMADAIMQRGYRFECEHLTTGEASLTISDDDADHDMEVVSNGPQVPEAVDRMIRRFHERLITERRKL